MDSSHESDQSAPPLAPNLTGEVCVVGRIPLASGGYSIVYKGEWRGSSGPARPVVVKILAPSSMSGDNTKMAKRLKREIRVWIRLIHPNIVPLLGFVDKPDGPGMVSPYFAEGTVLEFLKKHPYANREILCLDVTRGLQYLHSHTPQIIHGDIKGNNVLISPDGVACLCDFGLSLIQDDTPTGFTTSAFGGTLRYLAPELLDDHEKTVGTDVYALGCLFIEILFDVLPFAGIQAEAMLMSAIGKSTLPYDIPDIAYLFSTFPLHLLVRCWERDPPQRPALSQMIESILALLHRRHAFNQMLHDFIGCDVVATKQNGQKYTGTLCSVATDTSNIVLELPPTCPGGQHPYHFTIPLYRRSDWRIALSSLSDRGDTALESTVHCVPGESVSDRPSSDESTAVEEMSRPLSVHGGGTLDGHAFCALFRVARFQDECAGADSLLNGEDSAEAAAPETCDIQITKQLETENSIFLDVDGNVRSGTLSALVERLTSPEFRYEDLAFRNTFIETFPDFATINEVFSLLRMRFSVVYGDGEDERVSVAHTRLRVISALKEIMDTHDFSTPDELSVLDDIEDFLNDIAPVYPRVLHIVDHIQLIGTGARPTRTGKVTRPFPVMPVYSAIHGPLTLSVLPAIEIARHLTFMAHELLRNVQRKALLYHGTDRQPLDDSVTKVLVMQRKVSEWVVRCVHEAETSEQRTHVISYLISVATDCQNLRNFSIMSSIAGGLTSAFRQKRSRTSWTESPERHQIFKIMRDIPENSTEYRKVLKDHPLPSIPDIGKYITALLLVRESMSDFEDGDKKIINFRKPQQLASIISEFRNYQLHPYNMLTFEPILAFLDHALNASE